MSRVTISILAIAALTLPAAGQAITTVPLELFPDLPADSPGYDIALGSTVNLEVVAPAGGDLYVYVALVDAEGLADPATAALLWAQPLAAGQGAALQIPIPLGFPDLTVGVQALFIEAGGALHGSALHRLHLDPTID
jgi:hypothetical protein